MILIDHFGERCLVASLDGYPEAVVINDAVPEQPGDFHKLDDKGNWYLDEQAEHDGLLAAAFADKDAIIATLEARLDEVEATMMVIVPMVEQASGVSVDTGLPLA